MRKIIVSQEMFNVLIDKVLAMPYNVIKPIEKNINDVLKSAKIVDESEENDE